MFNMCDLHVDINMEEDNFIDLVKEICGGVNKGRDVYSDWVDFHISKNDSYSWVKKRKKEDGFLYYKFIIEVYSKMPENSFFNFLNNLRVFISTLKDKGAKVVPVCDFEDELVN